jgi:cysteine desulfurase
MRNYPDANCVVSAIEHEAVIAPAAQFNCKLLQVDQYGGVREDELRKLIDDNTVLVSIMYANNEIGTIQPLYRIKTILSEIRFERIKKGNSLPLYFHTDACQAPNYLQLRVNRLGVDMMTLNGSKIYGLKQSGMLYVNRDLTLTPLIYGGGQEKGMRSGTENVVGIIGFATALKETTALRDKEVVRLQDLQHKAWLYIAEHIPSAVVTGNAMPQLSNNLHVRFTDIDNERLMMELDEKGFQVAVGSACSASSDEPSHVLKAVGLTDKEAQSSIRITMGRQTTEVDLMALLHTIQQLVK